MTEDRNNHDDDLDFDDDFVVDDLHDTPHPDRAALPNGVGAAPADRRAAGHSFGGDADTSDGGRDEDDLFDDEFVIEFDDEDELVEEPPIAHGAVPVDPLGFTPIQHDPFEDAAESDLFAPQSAAPSHEDAFVPGDELAGDASSPWQQPAAAKSGLDGLFSRSDAGPVDELAEQEADELFTAHSTGGDVHAFEGVRARPDFVEDRAGWYGDDEDLAALVGETTAETHADDSLEFEEGLDDDPFALEEVEVEGADTFGMGRNDVFGASAGSLDADDDPLGDPDRAFELESGVDDQVELEVEFDSQDDGVLPSDDPDAAWDPQSYGVRQSKPAPEDFGLGSPYLGADVEAIDGERDPYEATDDGEGEAGTEGEWVLSARDEIAPEPDAEEYVDEIYGDVGVGMDAAPEETEADDGEEVGLVDPGYDSPEDEIDEAYVDATTGIHVVGGGGQVHRFPWRRAVAAAALLAAVGVGVVTLHPEWLGLAPAPASLARVEINRPRLDLSLPAPGEIVATPETPSTGPGTNEPNPEHPGTGTTDPVAVDPPHDPAVSPPDVPVIESPDPVAVTPPVQTPDPVVETTPGTGPVAIDPDPVPPVVFDPQPTPPPAVPVVAVFEPIEFGEGLEIRGAIDPDDYRQAGVQSVQPGTRAFAQLQNEETFVGVVKRVEATYVTLDLQPGEIQLVRAELTTLSPLDSADATEFTAIEHGFVRLNSDARLWGRILKNASSDNIILRTDVGRVTIPSSSLAGFGASTKSGSQLLDDDDRWLDERARRKLLEFSDPNAAAGPSNAATPPRGR